MNPIQPNEIVLEIYGEGKTDTGPRSHEIDLAVSGVVPILTRRICDDPATLRVRRLRHAFLAKKGAVWQKVRFAKRNAFYNGSAGCVYVLDSDGDSKRLNAEMKKGRDSEYPDFPMAVGLAHTCIEAWLLADASAIRKGLKLTGPNPIVPYEPESLPAPCKDRKNNPETVLRACWSEKRPPNVAEKSAIAEAMDLPKAESKCPSFKAFADEVRREMKQLFNLTPHIPESP